MTLPEQPNAMRPINLALCEDDKCPWKYRGVTAEATEEKAAEHAEATLHTVAIYEGERRVGRTGKLKGRGLGEANRFREDMAAKAEGPAWPSELPPPIAWRSE